MRKFKVTINGKKLGCFIIHGEATEEDIEESFVACVLENINAKYEEIKMEDD